MVGDTRALVGACTGTMDSPEPGRPDRPRAAAATGDAEDREEGKPASGAWLFLSKLQHDTVWWIWVGTKQERGERESGEGGRETERGCGRGGGGRDRVRGHQHHEKINVDSHSGRFVLLAAEPHYLRLKA